MQIDFTGQTALVTGGTRGIGKGIVNRLVESGCSVIATGTDPSALALLQAEADATGQTIQYRALDLADPAGTDTFAAEIAGETVDVLINNAGINYHAFTGETDMAQFDTVLTVNVRGPMALCRALCPGMAKRGYGRIVNMSSVLSVVSKAKRISYVTSKFALAGLTRTVALDYATNGVLANCVGPGIIDTEMTKRMLGAEGIRELVAQVPLGRLGTVEEIARVVAFLASPANSFVTGQNIIVDGGFTCT